MCKRQLLDASSAPAMCTGKQATVCIQYIVIQVCIKFTNKCGLDGIYASQILGMPKIKMLFCLTFWVWLTAVSIFKCIYNVAIKLHQRCMAVFQRNSEEKSLYVKDLMNYTK